MTTGTDRPPRTTDARLERAFELVADPRIRALTIDVFDTLLFRRVPDPTDAFPIVGARLGERGAVVDHVGPDEFRKLRIAAEEQARGPHRPEVTLLQIYEQIPRGLFHGADPADVAAVEVEVERELLVPDLDVMELIRAARAAGKQVVAISDTYFETEQLRSFMHPWFTREEPLDAIFASCEHGTNKAGGMFEVVLRELGVEAGEVVHVGDNEHADVESARRHGIRAVLFERRPKEVERVLEHERHYFDLERAGSDGDMGTTALRGKVLHRAELRELPEELRAFWTYGAVGLGPALAGFAEWVQQRALAAGVSKAFCLMREGSLLSDLVNRAGAYLDTGVAAESIWLSRQVVARGAILGGHEYEFRELLSRRSPPTVAQLCATLGVPVEASPLLARNAGARLNDGALVADVCAELAANPELRGPAIARAGRVRERIVEYVERALPDGERQLVLVDLGWGGSIQRAVQVILNHEQTGIATTGLYLVTDERATQRLLEGLDTSGFLASQGTPSVAMRAVMRSPEILEQACMPDVGSQLDLDADLEPVLDAPVDADRVQSAERAAVQKGVRAFQREWARYAGLEPGVARLVGPGARHVLLAQLARATASPTAAEAAAFAGWVHDENFGSAGVDPIVGSPEVRRALRHMDPETVVRLPMTKLYWPFGLALLEDEHLAEAVDAVTSGALPAAAFYSTLEVGDPEVYYDNGFGFGADWRVTAEGRRNRYGLSYLRVTLRADEVRGVRIDPVQAPCFLRVDWIALTCWIRGQTEPRRLTFETHDALARFVQRGLQTVGAKFFLTGHDPQLELDLREALGGATAYEVLVEMGYAVTLIDPRGEDAEQRRELERRAAQRSRSAKRLVRQVENRTGVPIGAPLRRAYRRLMRRG